jgi:hypothetical protein
MRLIKKHQIINLIQLMLIEYFSPINLNYFLNFGSLAGICLILQLVTGIPINCEATLALCDSSISTVGTNSLSKELLPLDTLGVDNSYSSYFSFRNVSIFVGISAFLLGLYHKYYSSVEVHGEILDIIKPITDTTVVDMDFDTSKNPDVSIPSNSSDNSSDNIDFWQVISDMMDYLEENPEIEFLITYHKYISDYGNFIISDEFLIKSDEFNEIANRFQIQNSKILELGDRFNTLDPDVIELYVQYGEIVLELITITY